MSGMVNMQDMGVGRVPTVILTKKDRWFALRDSRVDPIRPPEVRDQTPSAGRSESEAHIETRPCYHLMGEYRETRLGHTGAKAVGLTCSLAFLA